MKTDMKKIGAALLGCGCISDLHVLGYKNCSNAQIVALCNTNEEIAKQKGRK
jgi:predicted dehydrogenase